MTENKIESWADFFEHECGKDYYIIIDRLRRKNEQSDFIKKNINSLDSKGWGLLYSVIKSFSGNELYTECGWDGWIFSVRDLADHLFVNGANINLKNKNGETIFDIAEEIGNDNFIKLLKSVNSIETSLRRIFLQASTDRNINIMKECVEAGVDIDVKDKYGKTALMTASEKHETKIVQLLLEFGADIDIKNNYGETALQAIKKNLKSIPKLNQDLFKEVVELLKNPPIRIIDKQLSEIKWEEVYII